MSRQFDTTGGADSITFSAGGAPGDQGPITVAVLAKSASVSGYTGWMVRGLNSGTATWGLLTSNNAGPKLFAENDFGNGVSGLSTSWRWYVMTKASGGASVPRMHVWDLSGAWSHTDNSAGVADGTGPIDTIYVGSQNGSANGWRGSIAMVAVFGSELNDTSVEATFTLAALDTYNATPAWMIRLNQASTATGVTDDTGGGGDQSAISGTSVDADDPAGFDYSLTPPAVAPDSLSVPISLGAPSLADGSLVADPGSLSVPVALGAPSLADGSMALAPAGLSVPVSLGAPSLSITLAPHVSPDSLSVPVSLGAPSVRQATITEAPASWESYLTGIREARAVHEERQRRHLDPLDCPVHHWPLRPLGGHAYHCLFGGHVVHGHT